MAHRTRKSDWRPCIYCSKVFNAFRITAKYCNPSCKANYNNPQVTLRNEVLKQRGEFCQECKFKDNLDKLFVRWPKDVDRTLDNAMVLCAWHNSQLSLRLFRQRWPAGHTGYVTLLYQGFEVT